MSVSGQLWIPGMHASAAERRAGYEALRPMLASLLTGEHDLIANSANTSALLYASVPELNWVGFYFLRGGELIVGPFQGRPACVRIELGKGVCGTAAATRTTVLVPDVHAFAGHIACDAASRSEIVIPLVKGDALIGVLDIDSPLPARFDEVDRVGLEQLAHIFLCSLEAS
jgi:L-methionine (R)-S-oxide reductase